MTNADRIRQMTDEELASLNICAEVTFSNADYKCPDVDNCYGCKLAWLKQEVADNG